MKFYFDDQLCHELTDIQKQVIMNDIQAEIFSDDMIRRFYYPIWHSNRKHIRQNKEAWKQEMKAKGATSVPSDEMAFAAAYFQDKIDPSEMGRQHQVKVDGVPSFKLSRVQKELWRREKGHKDSPDADQLMKQDMCWYLQHKYERCLERLKREWEPKLKERGISELPIDDDAFCLLVFSQPDYKSRSAREEAEVKPEELVKYQADKDQRSLEAKNLNISMGIV